LERSLATESLNQVSDFQNNTNFKSVLSKRMKNRYFVLHKRIKMIERSILQQIIRDNLAQEFQYVRPRQQQLPLQINRVITLTGARRTGKTSLLFHTIRKLREELERERILYLNLEDDRLFQMELRDFDTVLDTYYSLYPENQNREVYFFFDEIQRIAGWETFVRRVKDTQNAKVYVTGSSADLLGREIATALRGRTLTYEVFPLSFHEYLSWKALPARQGTSSENRLIKNAFREYFSTTAFPELISWGERERIMALQEYIDLIIYRDVAERLKVANTHVLEYLIHYLLVNAGNPVSITGIYKDLKGQGLSVAKDTVFEYMNLLEDVYAIFIVPIFTSNLKVRRRNPGKLYILDHGLKHAVSMKQDQGAVLENIVFLELRRKYSKIFYWKEDQEVDFLIQRGDQWHPVNVSYRMEEEKTRARELSGMLSCLEKLQLPQGTIISMNEEQTFESGDKRIEITPCWKWLLEGY